MRIGTVIKSAEGENDLQLINQYTRKDLKADEVYTFSVVLCDNDVDRDYERFTVESLFSLQELFLGKTGIVDHNPKAENQSARIYKTEVEAVEGKITYSGDQYFRLKASAYIPICDSTKSFIERIETGILKEVSVGCAVSRTICSICGNEMDSHSCTHHKGEAYGDEVCVGELTEPTDAYEWSFVAVPAQVNAGVIKNFKEGVRSMEKIFSHLKSEGEITLNKNEKNKLLSYIKNLEKEAEDGRAYRKSLMEEVKRYALLSKCGIKSDTMDAIVKALPVSQLQELRAVYEKQASAELPIKPQTYVEGRSENKENNEFTI